VAQTVPADPYPDAGSCCRTFWLCKDADLNSILPMLLPYRLAAPDFRTQGQDRHCASQSTLRNALDGFPPHFSSHTNSASPPPEIFSVTLTDVLIFEIEELLNLERKTLQSRPLRRPGSCELPGFLFIFQFIIVGCGISLPQRTVGFACC
jgi:hypothetical protein